MTTNDDGSVDIPPTEPATPTPAATTPAKRGPGRPRKNAATTAAPTATATQVSGSMTNIAGSDLVPDLSIHSDAVDVGHFYWIGALPSCPVSHVTIAGECFPKIEEQVISLGGQTKRIPVIGAVVRLNKPKIRLMRERLRQTVIRFTSEPDLIEEPGTGKNIGDAHQRGRKGHPITIPTSEFLAERAKNKIPARPYRPTKNDEPVARYLFAQLCRDQDKGERGTTYPDVLEVTGLEWPGELD